MANNVGFTLGLFNRVNVNVDFYHKKTTNILMYVPTSYAITGEGVSLGEYRCYDEPGC
mgnify:FL=1